MLGTEIIDIVLRRLGRQESNAYLVTTAKLELQLIQTRLEGDAFLPWFLLYGDAQFTATINYRYLTLPSDFLREYDDYPLYLYDSTAADPYTRLLKDDFDVLESRFGVTSPGAPTHYALAARTLQLFPRPDQAYAFRWNYYQAQPTLDFATINTNYWTQHAADLLVAELGVVMAAYKRDASMAQLFTADVKTARRRLIAFDEARKQAARDAIRGDR